MINNSCPRPEPYGTLNVVGKMSVVGKFICSITVYCFLFCKSPLNKSKSGPFRPLYANFFCKMLWSIVSNTFDWSRNTLIGISFLSILATILSSYSSEAYSVE